MRDASCLIATCHACVGLVGIGFVNPVEAITACRTTVRQLCTRHRQSIVDRCALCRDASRHKVPRQCRLALLLRLVASDTRAHAAVRDASCLIATCRACIKRHAVTDYKIIAVSTGTDTAIVSSTACVRRARSSIGHECALSAHICSSAAVFPKPVSAAANTAVVACTACIRSAAGSIQNYRACCA